MAPISIPRAPVLKVPIVDVYVLNNPDEVQRGELVVLMLNSFQKPTSDHVKALSKMITIICSCIPEIEKYLSTNSGSVNFKALEYDDLVKRLSEGKAPEKEDSDDWAFSKIDPSCLMITSQIAIFASAAVAWMTYAKSAGESSRTALEQARPRMMKGKYSLSDDDSLLFPGESLGPAIEYLDQANLGFSLFPGIRHYITAFFISIRSSSNYLPPNADPFMLVFDMLKNVGMTHVGAIIKFVEMCPWSLKVPELAADFSIFASDLKKMSLVQSDVRPYHRLLVPQTDYLFVTSNVRPLVAVAGTFVEEVESTFKNYVYNAAQYTDLIDRVKQRAPLSSTIPDVQSLEQMFGVQAQEPRNPVIRVTEGLRHTTT